MNAMTVEIPTEVQATVPIKASLLRRRPMSQLTGQ
jgi:hypothetical protein